MLPPYLAGEIVMASRSGAWSGGRVAVGARKPWRSALDWIGMAVERRRQRARLAELEARLLRDIGLTCEAALAECRKPWWRR